MWSGEFIPLIFTDKCIKEGSCGGLLALFLCTQVVYMDGSVRIYGAGGEVGDVRIRLGGVWSAS